MIRRPPRSTLDRSSAASDVYKRQAMEIACKLNDTLSIADIYRVKGIIQSNLNNFELSEEFFENSVRLNDDFESKYSKAESSQELGTVSYTHLRAHETVLDLVCRLLLEKKKNNTQ